MNEWRTGMQNPDILDDTPTNPSNRPTIGDLVSKRYSRRHFVKGSLAVSAGAALTSLWGCSAEEQGSDIGAQPNPNAQNSKVTGSFNFTEISHGQGPNHLVSPDHQAQVLIRWGDPIFNAVPEFDPYNQSADSQEQRFGFNNDFIGYLSLPPLPGQQSRALLCVNHEYPIMQMMFDGLVGPDWHGLTAEHMEIEKAATGCSVVEVVQIDGRWNLDKSSQYNRRISARSTEFEVTGPAAGHPRLKTSADPSGKKVIGTLNNCAGGMTPWGTYLSCEENFNFHFSGERVNDQDHPEAGNYNRYGVPAGFFQWGRFDPRFNIQSEPNEPNRFGWVVEIDPLNPNSTPKKRTALGRFKHEGAENVIAPDGRLVIYMGDDQRFDYLYKFVSREKVNQDDPSANIDLLDRGTLYVAKFSDDGNLSWLAIEYGQEPLNEKNGFGSQADVLIETRRAADLLAATPMDRPEDVVPNPKTGKVYVMLTNNTKRAAEDTNVSNPRGPNPFGHIIEISEPNGDFAATTSNWNFLIKAGDPNRPEVEAQWHRDTSENGWLASPDNGVIDPSGRLWVCTDQGEKVPLSGTSDGLWAIETEGPLKGKGKMFFRCPNGAELCGPAFSDNGESLFLAVQHPGADEWNADTTNFNHPGTRWPDFKDRMPPRPSVLVIQRKNGGLIG